MNPSDIIRLMIKSRKSSQEKISAAEGKSKQSMQQRLARNTWQIEDFAHVADLLEYDVQIVIKDRRTNQETRFDIVPDDKE